MLDYRVYPTIKFLLILASKHFCFISENTFTNNLSTTLKDLVNDPSGNMKKLTEVMGTDGGVVCDACLRFACDISDQTGLESTAR